MQLLTRRNVFTGKRYSEDPAIFAWDIFNEPRNPQDQEVPGGHCQLSAMMSLHGLGRHTFAAAAPADPPCGSGCRRQSPACKAPARC
jgi:hypothetical protein